MLSFPLFHSNRVWWKTHLRWKDSVFQGHRGTGGWGRGVSMAGEYSGKKWALLRWLDPQHLVDSHCGSLPEFWGGQVSTKCLSDRWSADYDSDTLSQTWSVRRGPSAVLETLM
jgi:hypothetical protein